MTFCFIWFNLKILCISIHNFHLLHFYYFIYIPTHSPLCHPMSNTHEQKTMSFTFNISILFAKNMSLVRTSCFPIWVFCFYIYIYIYIYILTPLIKLLTPALWYQSHSFLAGDSVVVFSVSPSVSTRSFGAQLRSEERRVGKEC